MKKYLVAYTFTNYAGGGNGRTFGTTAAPVSEETIVEWERMIREANHFDSVGIYNFVELAS